MHGAAKQGGGDAAFFCGQTTNKSGEVEKMAKQRRGSDRRKHILRRYCRKGNAYIETNYTLLILYQDYLFTVCQRIHLAVYICMVFIMA